MISAADRTLIKETISEFDALGDLDVTGRDNLECVISFTTSFGKEAAYDLQLSENNSSYEAVLLTSSETPLMRDEIDALDREQIDSLFDHVIETLRELEGN